LQTPRRVVVHARYLLVAAVVFCLLAAALVTRFGNQPVNAIVMTWNPQSPRRSGRNCATPGGNGTWCAQALKS
jgi:hypothetical protein